MVSIGVISMLVAGLGVMPAVVPTEGPALPAEVTGRLGDERVLGIATGAGIAAGFREDHKRSGAPQSEMASTSLRRALCICCHSARFSASMSLTVTL